MTPEFSRPFPVARIGPNGRRECLTATAAECAALAARFAIPAITRLEADLVLTPSQGGTIVAEGWLRADVVQCCVVTLDPVPEAVDTPLHLRFIPAGDEPSDDPETPDEIEIERGQIDLGEAVAEQLSLALDPYPRAPGAALPAPLAAPAEAAAEPARLHPFAALARRKPRH